MAKTKERSEIEYLRAENKKIRSENRHLKKLIGRNSKRLLSLENNIDDSIEDGFEEVEKNNYRTAAAKRETCPKCQSELKRTDLGGRILLQCNECNYRKSEKK